MTPSIRAGELELWVERRGDGPEVLLIAGLGDPAEAWSPSSTGSPTATASRRTTTAARDARRFPTNR